MNGNIRFVSYPSDGSTTTVGIGDRPSRKRSLGHRRISERRHLHESSPNDWTAKVKPSFALSPDAHHRPQSIAAPRWKRHAFGLAATTILTLLAQANLIDVYGNHAAWLAIATISTLLGVSIALSGVIVMPRLWIQPALLVCAQFIIGPTIILNNTAIAHVIPTLDTLMRGWERTFGAFKILICLEPPTGTSDGLLMALWTIGLWAATISGMFAISDSRQAPTLYAATISSAFIACALLGSNQGWHSAFRGALAMLILTLWEAYRSGMLERRRGIRITIIVTISMALALGLCMLIPQHRLVLRDHYVPPDSLLDRISPLSGIRSYIKDHRDDVILTVTNLPEHTPIRLAVMEHFDGVVWNMSDAPAEDRTIFHRIGDSLHVDEQGTPFQASFIIGEGLDTTWLPLAGALTSIDFSERNDARSFLYNASHQAGMLLGGVRQGMTYTVSGIIPETPSKQQVIKAEADAIAQPIAQDVPDIVSDMATAIAGGKATGGEAAITLADALRQYGWFSHGLADDYPSPAGHGNYRITMLLGGDVMVGDSEQYASAMALMAREIGLSSRVVMGFRSGEKTSGISNGTAAQTTRSSQSASQSTSQSASQSTSQSTSQPTSRTTSRTTSQTTTFTGNDVCAWVEIKLEGLGWVAFDPTPNDSNTPDTNRALASSDSETLVRQAPVPLTNPLRDRLQASGHSSLNGQDADALSSPTPHTAFKRILRDIAVYGSPVWVMVLLGAAILVCKAALFQLVKTRGTPRKRVIAGWQFMQTLSERNTMRPEHTRTDQAALIGQQTMGMDLRRDVIQLSQEADYAAFSGHPLSNEQARRYWDDVKLTYTAIMRSKPRLTRLRAAFSLSVMARLIRTIRSP